MCTKGNAVAILLKTEQAAWNKGFLRDLGLNLHYQKNADPSLGILVSNQPIPTKESLKGACRTRDSVPLPSQPLALGSLRRLPLPWDCPRGPWDVPAEPSCIHWRESGTAPPGKPARKQGQPFANKPCLIWVTQMDAWKINSSPVIIQLLFAQTTGMQ